MGSIAILGIGRDDTEPLSEETVERLKAASLVVASAAEGRVAQALSSAGVSWVPLAELDLSLDMPVERIIQGLVAASARGDVVYATAGYPFLKEGLLAGLLSLSGVTLEVYPSLSPLQVILMAFDIDLTADLDIIDVGSFRPSIEQRDSHLILTGIRNSVVAARASAKLGEIYPADHAVVVAVSHPHDGFALSMHTVADLADAEMDGDCAAYVAPSAFSLPTGFEEFVRIIEVLRGPDGCPWDRAQDHMSLRRHMLEEAYEAVAAIESGDDAELAGELGDVLLQVVLHAQIATDEERFTIDDVIAGITAKIRRRHPHVFGDAVADTPAEVHARWDEIKRAEKAGGEQSEEQGLLGDIPASLPALMRAQKISRRVVGVGFEWETLEDVWTKFHEEVDELKATEPGSPEAAEEIGDILFTLVNVARKQGIDAEEALRSACDKFTLRWRDMERAAADAGRDIAAHSLEEMEDLWRSAKERERSGDADT